ncbi:MAG: hypothetical protein AMJ65_18440 [Phycisphaerae bacterium SG8_4]|nr:MAG: hypothetical protein AMJ65_18440 [Phycisphaerae bacterium SG8_4]
MNRRNKMALLVAAIFLAGSPGINAADPVKFISFDVAKVSPAGCKIMVTVEMLLDDLLFSDDVEPAWYGYFKYQPPSGTIKTMQMKAGKVTTKCGSDKPLRQVPRETLLFVETAASSINDPRLRRA